MENPHFVVVFHVSDKSFHTFGPFSTFEEADEFCLEIDLGFVDRHATVVEYSPIDPNQ